MRYHYEKPDNFTTIYGKTYYCNHPIYDKCTLYLIDDKGLAVIQQRIHNKRTFWEDIDPWLNDVIYLNKNFYSFFQTIADYQDPYGLYPTVSIRTIMHSLKMKPIPKERWETVFDRRII